MFSISAIPGRATCVKQVLCWMTSVHCTYSLKGISEPDALFGCVNADACVPQPKRAWVGRSSRNSSTSFHHQFMLGFQFLGPMCWRVKQQPGKQLYSSWQANVAIQRWLRLQSLWMPQSLSDLHSKGFAGYFFHRNKIIHIEVGFDCWRRAYCARNEYEFPGSGVHIIVGRKL